MTAEVRIGTSGWYYKHWRGIFYGQELPPLDMLPHFASHFDTVEINNTFYALPAPDTPKKWREKTPPRFCFALKASRFLTHIKRLKDPGDALDRFFNIALSLEEKLGPILFQLPPRWKRNRERLELFLDALPAGHRYVFEFRDPTWETAEIYDLLRSRNAAFCITSRRDENSPLEITADFTYIRFHGGPPELRGNYNTDSLRRWAERLDQWRSSGLKAIYGYFNNDWEGFALNNAQELKHLLGYR